MIPIRDDAPRLTVPFVVWSLIAANLAVFWQQFSLSLESPEAERAFATAFGVVPARISGALTGGEAVGASLLPIMTSMFLHGGWLHLLGNMWFLWIFGDNVEDELGHGVFLLFYVGCGIAAALAQYLANPLSAVPMVGASGAIAGVMGAYLIRFPRARVTILAPIVFFWFTFQVPAFFMLTYWLATQVYSGASSGGEGGGVAWWAHIGGFAAGVALVCLRPRRREWDRRWRR